MSRNLTNLTALFFLVLGAMTAGAGLLSAHHGRGGSYDETKIVTMTGVVTEWAWRNPHCALYVDAKDDSGKVVNWGFESQNVSSLSHLGMTRNSFKAGQQITIKFNPSRSGAAVGVIRKIYDTNGKELLSFGGPIDQ
jgi:hypothetical protein